MLTPDVMSMLWCPTCRESGLRPTAESNGDAPLEHGELRCDACDTPYPVRFGVPVLIPEAAMTGHEWKLWRDHLGKLQARREVRISNPDQTIHRLAKKSKPKPRFARFTGIEEGTVLDVGCGPGKFRFHFDPARVKYVGLDPLFLPEVSAFPFVQGLAEYLPFMDDTFTDIVVLAALDHFRDLDRFFHEARRVLRAGGRLHILQSVREVRGPVSAVKVIAHRVKDVIEEMNTNDRHVPKHLAEFTTRSLPDRVGGAFDVVATERYSASWYSPVETFLTFAPKEEAKATTRPR